MRYTLDGRRSREGGNQHTGNVRTGTSVRGQEGNTLSTTRGNGRKTRSGGNGRSLLSVNQAGFPSEERVRDGGAGGRT